MGIKKQKTNKEIQTYLKERVSINHKTTCWEWQMGTNNFGYGRAKISNFKNIKRIEWLTHRLSYTVFVKDIPYKLFVCHTCDNPKCCNPDHLFLGTHQDNMDDMAAKGRKAKPPIQYGNNHAGKKVIANFVEYKNYVEAGEALGISDNGVRKRVKSGKLGYKTIEYHKEDTVEVTNKA